MESSYFYSNLDKNDSNAQFIEALQAYAISEAKQIYLLNKPLGDKKYSYSYSSAAALLVPGIKIVFVDFGNDPDGFEEFKEDFIEDIGAISDKFRYKDFIGRPRSWKDKIFSTERFDLKQNKLDFVLKNSVIANETDQKICELLISLLTGSINDIDRVKSEIPDNLLDKIKQKIVLFDGDQTRFIYDKPEKHIIRIQGLSGTGKTELLLHKLKDVYTSSQKSRILFTCHNKILAHNLRKRIPGFFNFMKVEQQIEWNERLMCVHAWGSSSDRYSGAYSFICNFYNIPFMQYSFNSTFDLVCKNACESIKELITNKGKSFEFAFSYIFVDESQDFPQSFFELCSLVTKTNVYIAGDIFQSIFDNNITSSISPDHLLSKCYRTDPKTLMFAHALGMGLFEKEKLRWLEDSEWAACGYTFVKKEGIYKLQREHLRRFEDLQSFNFNSVDVVFCDEGQPVEIETRVVDFIEKIKHDNQTVKPDDIGIILLDGTKDSYLLADKLEQIIPREIGWEVNKAYESKEKKPDSVLISNRNNVKGLEFPFVICITSDLRKSYSFRNALYTMLTRSFLQSTLIITKPQDANFVSQIKQGLANINENGQIVVAEPTEAEKIRIRTTIQQRESKLSLYDQFHLICDDFGIEKSIRQKLYSSFKEISDGSFDLDFLEEWINSNYSLFLKKKKSHENH